MTDSPENNPLVGMKEIAGHIGKTIRKAYYLCETGQIPAFKLADQWHLRPSTYATFIAHLETQTLRRKDQPEKASENSCLAPPRRGRPPKAR